MAVSPVLTVAVGVSALFAASVLLSLVRRSLAFGPTRVPNAWNGVRYAFTKGMLPWEKESAGRHGTTLAAGVLYHAGVFLALLQLAAFVLGFYIPALVVVVQIFIPISLLSGVGLFLKRTFAPMLRALSCPDDYAANLVVDLFLLFSFLAAVDAAWINWLLGISVAFFVYMPLGKIRHCVFFFCTRVLFGRFFGTRGVLPHPRREAP